MKAGLVFSTALHTAVLTWGLWSLSAPDPLDVSSVESMPVDLVSIEEFSEAVAGAREAPLAETPAPTPTQTPETLPMPAENVGDNEVDLPTPPTPVERPRPVEQAAAAQPAPAPPEPAPAPEPEPAPVEIPPPVETPPAETPADATPPEPVEADPVEQAIAEAEAAPAVPPAPRNVPVPATKPAPPRPAVAETRQPERPPEQPQPTEQAEIQTPEESEFDADQIAALLNREQAAGGGARRSEQQAALGTQRTTGATLSQSELDALRGQIQRCWSPPAGVSEAGSLRISIQLRLDPSGALETVPQIVGGGGDGSMVERIAGEAALRAVRRCAPYNLPAEKYETWADVIVNFDPSQMF
ncbi:MAG TPA: hypothetical protein VGO17_05235 [Aurantimonas sp.]|nr:hypothetical protein [Aurantimonas sp.]